MIREMIQYYSANGAYVFAQIVRHFLMSFYGVLFASVVGVILGFYSSRHPLFERFLMRVVNLTQSVPALAMLSLLMVVVGLGANTVVLGVFIYSLLPILQNTLAGLKQVDKHILDVAKSMGMSPKQVLLKVELPLAFPLILGGIRNALVVGIGISAVGTFIGAGGLGDIISRGLNVSHGAGIVWAGALPCALMAFVVDLVLSQLEKRWVIES